MTRLVSLALFGCSCAAVPQWRASAAIECGSVGPVTAAHCAEHEPSAIVTGELAVRIPGIVARVPALGEVACIAGRGCGAVVEVACHEGLVAMNGPPTFPGDSGTGIYAASDGALVGLVQRRAGRYLVASLVRPCEEP